MGFLSVLGGLVGNIIAPGIGGAIGAGLGGAVEGSDSVDQASQAQQQSAQGGIDEQRRQFEAIQKLLSPYVDAGTNAIPGLAPYAAAGAPALGQQQALLGLNGPDAEREAIARISDGGHSGHCPSKVKMPSCKTHLLLADCEAEMCRPLLRSSALSCSVS